MGELSQTVSLQVEGHLARLQLTRADAARALGTSAEAIADLLGNRRAWQVDEVDRIAEWLEVDPKALFFPEQDG